MTTAAETLEPVEERAPLAPAVVATTGIEFSSTLANIAKALIIAQGNMSEIHKDSVNPHFKSKYADLPTCVEAVQPALQAAGIAFIQAATSNADASVVFVETMFLHESGEWVRSRLGLRPVKSDPQGAGSAITYGRRYTLLAMCGVAPEEDDDGNRGSGRAERVTTRASRPVAEETPPPRSVRPAASQPTGNGTPKGSVSREDLLKKVYSAHARLGLGDGTINTAVAVATDGHLDDASQIERMTARELVAYLKVLYDTPCDVCRSLALHPDVGHAKDQNGVPCPCDDSPEAIAASAAAGAAERNPENELPL